MLYEVITFYLKLSSPHKKLTLLKDFYHGILFEQNRSLVYDYILNFAKQAFEIKNEGICTIPEKFTKDEHDCISLKMIPWHEKVNFAMQKFSLGKIGKLSKGMCIGLEYGFDSGISLDYVYQNKAQGKIGFGKMMDKNYLNAIGWKGIRKRKQHLLQLLESQIEKLLAENKTVKILDIAAGTGNYLFDIIKKYPQVEVVANDFVKSNIEVGEKYLTDNNIKNMRFTNYDCFDSANYAKLNFKPNIVVVSGIFELFEDNEQVLKAINGLTTIAEPNAAVIYTGQPWHPQLKTIAYVLKSHLV